MRVAANTLPPALRDTIAAWGWTLTEEQPDAILTAADGVVEIRTAPHDSAVDFVIPPLRQDELTRRIERAAARRAQLAKRLHDLRSPLNAIHGYAEIIAESADGDLLRFASNIRTASELLVNRLQSWQEEGV